MMERIGLIGGVSWVSTMEYYKRLNTFVQSSGERFSSADIVMISLNFCEILAAQQRGDEQAEFAILSKAALQLQLADVKKIAICSNTTSNTCDRLAETLDIPIINIIDATTTALLQQDISHAGLLGTQYVMERHFYRSRLEKRGIKVSVPSARTRSAIHDCIYNDLCHNRLSNSSVGIMYRGIDELAEAGCQAVVLGCTEIPLVVNDAVYQNDILIIDSIDAHLAAIYPTYVRVPDRQVALEQDS